jgi:hypothetical protein
LIIVNDNYNTSLWLFETIGLLKTPDFYRIPARRTLGAFGIDSDGPPMVEIKF